MQKTLIIIVVLSLFLITPFFQVFAANQGVQVEKFEKFTLYPGKKNNPYSIVIPIDLKHYGRLSMNLEIKSMSKEKLKLYNKKGILRFRVLDREYQNKTSKQRSYKFILQKNYFFKQEKSFTNHFIDEPELTSTKGRYDIMLSNMSNRTFTGVIFYSYPGSKKEARNNWKAHRERYPDIAVDDLFLTKDHYVAVKIKNIGIKDLPEALWPKKHAPPMLVFFIDKQPKGISGMNVIDPDKRLLKSGSQIIYKTKIKISRSTTIKAIFDPERRIKEFDKKNNSLIKAIGKNPTQNISSRALPDLSVKSVRLVNNKIVVKIVNNAKYGVPARYWKAKGKNACTLTLKFNNKNWGGATLQGFDPRKKLSKPGSVVRYEFNHTLTSKTRVQAFVDSSSAVKESNEKNNKLEVVLKP